ncbi:MAG: RNA polymerase sigma-70 factor [Flavitalea sp.]
MQQHSCTYDHVELLNKIAAGNEQAFAELYNSYWKKVYAFLFRMTKSRQIAEELMSDIFTKLWTGRELIADINDMDAFLAKVAYNKALNFFRYTARQKKLHDIIVRQAMDGSPAAQDPMSDYEIKELIREAIDHLSPQRKLIYRLSREYRLSNEQIAKELNLSPSTVKKTMSLALRSLKTFLHKRGIEGAASLYFLFSL